MENLSSVVFQKASEAGASDVHIAVGYPVVFRINGEMVPQTKQIVTAAQAEQFVKACLDEAGFKRYKEQREIDTSFALKNGVRLRVNCHFERGNMSLVARIIPSVIPEPASLGLTELVEKFNTMDQGLILFTGPTGSGKSTSLASIIHEINKTRAVGIVTLEDPIEFLFPEAKGLVRQREYGEDFHSFADALKHVLRQDPDIVMVGEMRDPETIAAALTLAETGHLIFATLHTPNAVQSVDRIIDVFPPHQQGQVRSQLSLSLRAIVAQRLIPKKDGTQMALREVLLNNPAVGNIIRDNRPQELQSVLQTNEAIGMYTFEKALKRVYKEDAITKETYDWVVGTL